MAEVELRKVNEAAIAKITETKDWYAWNNLMPPPPHSFHVVGQVEVCNPGVKGYLLPLIPQGINPAILRLELVLVQEADFWPQVTTWVEVRYDRVIATPQYQSVMIMSNGGAIAEVAVTDIH